MSAYQRIASVIDEILMLVVLSGLAVRGRWRVNLFFDAYVFVAAFVNIVVNLWPERFYEPGVWVGIELLGAFLKLGAVLEATWRTFRFFRGAQASALWAALAVLASTAVAASTVPLAATDSSPVDITITQFEPRLLNGVVWIAGATLIVVWWCRVPLHPLRAVVLVSLAIYSGVCSALYTASPLLNAWFDPDMVYLWRLVLEGATFTALAAWWGFAAWRPDDRYAAHQQLAQRLTGASSSCG